MTRTARREKKKHLDATSWTQFKGSSNNGGVIKKKNEKLSKDKVVKAIQQGSDLIKFTRKSGSFNYKTKREKCSGKRIGKKTKSDLIVVDEKRLLMREKRKLRRAKMKECFGCRKPGHRLEDCPKRRKEDKAIGICFKCGSAEHGVSHCNVKVPKGSYPFAKCFICGEMGHLTRSCPDNPKGLYPHGGCCNLCGSVEHLKTNCPERHKLKKESEDSLVQVASYVISGDADTVTNEVLCKKQTTPSKTRIVKF